MLIVGGYFGPISKKSGIVKKLSDILQCSHTINGGTDLQKISVKGHQIILWFPDVDNYIEKCYPQKDIGSVLICSKIVRPAYSRPEMLSRIFKMHANAIILISKENNPFTFEFVDALNNTWNKTSDLYSLANTINEFTKWTMASKRCSLQKDAVLEALTKLNRQVADRHEADMGRYFGNLSTRCMKMFPSTRFFFSKRNVDKTRITADDMVLVQDSDLFQPTYYGPDKPSIDTPVQLELYRQCPNLNYFIHGHAYIPGYPETEEYFPCGDLREVPGIIKLINEKHCGIINLKNHGFLIYATGLQQLIDLVEIVKFGEKK
jgi:hypothetical protein